MYVVDSEVRLGVSELAVVGKRLDDRSRLGTTGEDRPNKSLACLDPRGRGMAMLHSNLRSNAVSGAVETSSGICALARGASSSVLSRALAPLASELPCHCPRDPRPRRVMGCLAALTRTPKCRAEPSPLGITTGLAPGTDTVT